MSLNRKPRSDAKLKTLPEERQAAIVEYSVKHSLAKTATWLGENGVEICKNGVGLFLYWYRLREQLAKNESTVRSLLEDLKRYDSNLTLEQLEIAGQVFFSALAIDQQDSVIWKRIQDMRLKAGQLELNREKSEVQRIESHLKWRADKKMEALADDPKMSNTEKIAAMRKEAFKDVDEFIASGELKLPKA